MGTIWQRVSAPFLCRSSYDVFILSRSISSGYVLNRRKSSQDNCKLFPKRRENVGLSQNFFRLKNGDTADLVGELQTSIVTYRKKIPELFSDPFLKVDLVSEVHFANKRYFKILRKRLENYDCVLYEDIRVDTRDIEKISNLHAAIFDLKPLFMPRSRYHKQCGRHNWINADIDLQTFLQLLKAAKRRVRHLNQNVSNTHMHPKIINLPTLIRECLICKKFRVNVRESLESLYELGLQNYWKFLIARSMVDVEYKEMTPLELAERSVIIIERNKIAIEELKKAINGGVKSIAILYGAAHMPDIHSRLYKEFNLVPTSVDWITAWSIKKTKFKIMRKILEKCFGKDIAMTMILASYSFYFSVASYWLRSSRFIKMILM